MPTDGVNGGSPANSIRQNFKISIQDDQLREIKQINTVFNFNDADGDGNISNEEVMGGINEYLEKQGMSQYNIKDANDMGVLLESNGAKDNVSFDFKGQLFASSNGQNGTSMYLTSDVNKVSVTQKDTNDFEQTKLDAEQEFKNLFSGN